MLCANGNLPRKGQVRTDPTMRWSVIHTHLYSHRTRLCHVPRDAARHARAAPPPCARGPPNPEAERQLCVCLSGLAPFLPCVRQRRSVSSAIRGLPLSCPSCGTGGAAERQPCLSGLAPFLPDDASPVPHKGRKGQAPKGRAAAPPVPHKGQQRAKPRMAELTLRREEEDRRSRMSG